MSNNKTTEQNLTLLAEYGDLAKKTAKNLHAIGYKSGSAESGLAMFLALVEEELKYLDFKKYFADRFPFISHEVDEESQRQFVKNLKDASAESIAFYFSDYILANGLETEIQL